MCCKRNSRIEPLNISLLTTCIRSGWITILRRISSMKNGSSHIVFPGGRLHQNREQGTPCPANARRRHLETMERRARPHRARPHRSEPLRGKPQWGKPLLCKPRRGKPRRSALQGGEPIPCKTQREILPPRIHSRCRHTH